MKHNLQSALLTAVAAAVFCSASPLTQAQAPAASSAAPAANEYKLGSGDVIRIAVYQNLDLTLETRVTEAGLVTYPLLGTIRLGGLGVTAAEKLISDGLRNGNFVKQPQVTIVILQVRGNQASVLGQVNRPGRFPLEVADMRLTDLLATAGGTSPVGSDLVVLSGTRNGAAYRIEVDLPTLFGPGGRDKDVVVQNGDTLWATSTPIEQVNAGGRAYSGVVWAKPTVGASYRLTAIATNGARFRMTVKDKATGALAFDSGDLSNGQSVDFVWLPPTFTISTTAKSGVSGVESSVRADLRAVPAVTQAANQGCV